MVEQTPRNQNLDANNSINRLADAIAGIATQQRPEAATMLKPVSTNTLIFDGKNEKFELFEDLYHTMLKMQPEMTEAMKINHFYAHLRKEALQTFRNISALNNYFLHVSLSFSLSLSLSLHLSICIIYLSLSIYLYLSMAACLYQHF